MRVLLCLMACAIGWGQTWKPWPMQDQWQKACAHCFWSLPKQFEWKDIEGHSLRVRFVPAGRFDSEGTPEGFMVRAEDLTTHHRSTWSIRNTRGRSNEPQRRIYEAFMATGAALRLMDLGMWRVWELSIDPMTNGAPPQGLFWILQEKGSDALSVCGASSYGVMGYRLSENQLELRSIGEEASLGSIETLSWIVRSENGRLRARVAPRSWLFVLGGLDHLVSAPTKQSSDHQGVCLLARPVLRVDPEGGEAGPLTDSLAPDTLTYLQDWSLQIPHYSTDVWAGLHWAWVSDWNVGPKRTMVPPTSTAVRFTWAGEVCLFDPKRREDHDLRSLSPAEATRMATDPRWQVVLAERPGAAPEAVALIPPEF